MSAKYLCTCMKGFVCVFDTYDKKCKRIGKSCVSQNEVLEDKTSLPHIQFVTTLQYSSQPHNQLFHSRHPQCDIVAHSRRQEIDVNRKRRFTVVVFHSFGEDKQSLNDRLRERLAIQGVEQRVYPPFQIINKAFLLGRRSLLQAIQLLQNDAVRRPEQFGYVATVSWRIFWPYRSPCRGG